MLAFRPPALFLAFLALLALAAPARAQIDLAAADGPERTCPRFRDAQPAKLRADAERVAFAICNAIDMVREAATRFRQFNEQQQKPDHSFVSEIRARLERVLVRLRASRAALEGVKGDGPYFVIRPGDWAIDWDGDGRISDTERYLLWVPRRGVDAFRSAANFASPAAYHEAQFVAPRIRVDRADLLWAIAYCNFIEGALNLLLSYEVVVEPKFEIRLKDAGRLARLAYRNLLDGVRASGLLREALPRERDDEDEWIPNARQKETSFPLAMDEQTFLTWGALLGHMDKLLRGRTLLGGTVASPEARNLRDLSMGVCEPGEGLDVQSLWTDPVRSPMSPDSLKSRCRKPSAARPLTGLAAMIAESARRNAGRSPESFSGEWMILRHFYWVN